MSQLEEIKSRAEKATEARLEYNSSGADVEEVMSLRAAFISERSSYDVPKLIAALEAVEAVIDEHEARTPFSDADEISKAYSLGKHHGYERVRFEITEALQ